jgi:hypothetical protein
VVISYPLAQIYRQFCTMQLRPEHTGPIFLSISLDFNRKLWTFTPGSRSEMAAIRVTAIPSVATLPEHPSAAR